MWTVWDLIWNNNNLKYQNELQPTLPYMDHSLIFLTEPLSLPFQISPPINKEGVHTIDRHTKFQTESIKSEIYHPEINQSSQKPCRKQPCPAPWGLISKIRQTKKQLSEIPYLTRISWNFFRN